MKQIFEFINNLIFRMTWLNDLIGMIIEKVLGMPIDNKTITGKIGGSIQFFIYDTVKILCLLSVLIFIFSYIESKYTPEKTQRILSKLKGLYGAVIGALLGTVTPFCSCSSIPIFISFVKAGLPMEVTMSFLISSPFVDLASTVLLASMFGWKLALVYVAVGVLLAVIGGMVIGKKHLEKYIQEYVFNTVMSEQEEYEPTRKERIEYAKGEVRNIFTNVWKYVLLGVGIGAIIHNWIPQIIVETVIGNKNPLAPVLAALISVPMYADIFGTMPIAEALIYKGTQVGTILTFMMGVTALSVPSVVMLKQVMKKELITIFVSVIVIGIILIGYVFNMFSIIFI